MSQRTAHLSRETIDAMEMALFSTIAEANTELRRVPAHQWTGCSDLWVTRRVQSLSALREVLTYAESRYLKPRGSVDSMCALAASFFHERGYS